MRPLSKHASELSSVSAAAPVRSKESIILNLLGAYIRTKDSDKFCTFLKGYFSEDYIKKFLAEDILKSIDDCDYHHFDFLVDSLGSLSQEQKMSLFEFQLDGIFFLDHIAE